MTIYAKPAVRHAWAETAAPTDITDPGDTYASAGWKQGVKPPRQYDNWFYNYTMAAVRYFCQQGVSDWDATETYAINGIVQAGDNRLYQALKASTNVNPVGDLTGTWGPVQGAPPASTDRSGSLATTAWVGANFLPQGSSFAAITGQVTAGQVPVGAVTQWQGSLTINGNQVASAVAQANLLFVNGAGYAQFNWVGVGGQPTWIPGSNNGTTFNVYNPANFSVANAQTLAGLSYSVGAGGSTIVARDSSGDIYGSYFNSAAPNNENPSVSQVMVTNGADGWLRKIGLAALLAQAQTVTQNGNGICIALGGGVKLQAGPCNPNNNYTQVTYPVPFTSFAYPVAVSEAGGSVATWIKFGSRTLAGFILGNSGGNAFWVAVGI